MWWPIRMQSFGVWLGWTVGPVLHNWGEALRIPTVDRFPRESACSTSPDLTFRGFGTVQKCGGCWMYEVESPFWGQDLRDSYGDGSCRVGLSHSVQFPQPSATSSLPICLLLTQPFLLYTTRRGGGRAISGEWVTSGRAVRFKGEVGEVWGPCRGVS